MNNEKFKTKLNPQNLFPDFQSSVTKVETISQSYLNNINERLKSKLLQNNEELKLSKEQGGKFRVC